MVAAIAELVTADAGDRYMRGIGRQDCSSRAPGPTTLHRACNRIEAMMTVAENGVLSGRLSDLALAVDSDVEAARQALGALDPIAFEVTLELAADLTLDHARFTASWSPVTPIVDLLLDWDLLTIDISLDELAEWLEVSATVATRALTRLASLPGVSYSAAGDPAALITLEIDVDRCPLTAPPPVP